MIQTAGEKFFKRKKIFLKSLFCAKYKNVKPNDQRTEINCKKKEYGWL